MVPKEERALLTKNKTFVIPNVQEEARIFEWAGVSFGEEETFKLQKALKRLAILSGASRLRFWGKIFGIQRDYWVIEGVLDAAEEAPSHWSHERRGDGVNKLVYWVNDNLLEDWVQLPDATPAHIKAARQIKHVCTGNLNASIDSNPPFPGKERHFLRAQIARITHATSIIPKGLMEIDAETGKEKYVDEFNVPGTEELKSMEQWSHQYLQILQAGRITHIVDPAVPDEGKEGVPSKEEVLADLNGKDPQLEPYKGINEDAPVTGLPAGLETGFAWISKVLGDTQPYNNLPPKEGTSSYAVNVIKSLRWPGAVTVAQGGKFASIYVGYGIKKGDTCFNPIEPPEIQRDPVDHVEQPEPTPLTAPEQLPEPDTDAAKKAEGEDGGEA
jgi:radial spoke head protein 4A